MRKPPSILAIMNVIGMMAYNVSKHAVVTMSETLAQELRDIDANVSTFLSLSSHPCLN